MRSWASSGVVPVSTWGQVKQCTVIGSAMVLTLVTDPDNPAMASQLLRARLVPGQSQVATGPSEPA